MAVERRFWSTVALIDLLGLAGAAFALRNGFDFRVGIGPRWQIGVSWPVGVLVAWLPPAAAATAAAWGIRRIVRPLRSHHTIED